MKSSLILAAVLAVSLPAAAQNPVNRAPVAEGATVQATAGQAVLITLKGSDPDGNPISFKITQPPARGTLTPGSIFGNLVANPDGPLWTYVPAGGVTGEDSFKFIVSDGSLQSAPATVVIKVGGNIPPPPVNRAPVAAPKTATVQSAGGSVEIPLSATDPDGDALTGWRIDSLPAHGSAELRLNTAAGPNVLYRAAAGFSGTDTFTYSVADVKGLRSAPATVTVSVASNHRPVATPQQVSVNAGSDILISLNGTDPDNDALVSFTITTPPQRGTLTQVTSNSPNGALILPNVYRYRPGAGTNDGTDSFKFRVTDSRGLNSEPAQVTIAILPVKPPVNLPPEAFNAFFTTQGQPVTIALNARDPENAPLTFKIVTEPEHGKLSPGVSILGGPDGNIPTGANVFVYTPAPGYSGPDKFTWKANDGVNDSGLATVSLAVQTPPANKPPVAKDVPEVHVRSGQSVTITLPAEDPEHDPLTWIIVAKPEHGQLFAPSANGALLPDGAGKRIYTPAAGYTGPDSFTFKVNDGKADSNVAKVSIIVDPALPQENHPPVARQIEASVNAGTSITIRLQATDADGDALKYSIVSQPEHGTLVEGWNDPRIMAPTPLDASLWSYTPAAGYSGPDSFTFKANDGKADSNVARVTIRVIGSPPPPANLPPVAKPQTVTTSQGSPVTIMLSGEDPEGKVLTCKIVRQPSHGKLAEVNTNAGTGNVFGYMPQTGFSGTDSFTFIVSDGALESKPAEVVILVRPAPASSVVLPRGSEWKFLDDGSDQGEAWVQPAFEDAAWTAGKAQLGFGDGDEATVLRPGKVTYYFRRAFNFQRTNTTTRTVVRLLADDGAAVYLNGNRIGRVNLPDTWKSSTPATRSVEGLDEQRWVEFVISSSQLINGVNVVAAEVHQAASFSNTPGLLPPLAVADLSFDLEILTDGTAPPPPAGNRPPVAFPQTISVKQNTPQVIRLAGSDPDGDGISFVIKAEPEHGTLEPAVTILDGANGLIPAGGAAFLYTPDEGYTGPDKFSFVVSDGKEESAAAEVMLNVRAPENNGGNRPPFAMGQQVTVKSGSSAVITLAGTDPDGDPVTFSITVQPEHGVLTGAAPELTYTPAAGYTGPDAFTFKVNDGAADSAPAPVAIYVRPVNEAPKVAVAIEPAVVLFRAAEVCVISTNGTTADVTLDASQTTDPENDALTFRWTDGDAEIGAVAEISLTLPVGLKGLKLTVSDGVNTVIRPVEIRVTTLAGAVERIASRLSANNVPGSVREQLKAVLAKAAVAFRAGNNADGAAQLRVFQNLVRSLLARPAKELCGELVRAAQTLIDYVTPPPPDAEDPAGANGVR